MDLHFHKLGTGPTLLILHGLYGSGDNWHNIAKALSDVFTVYLIDQRNHGQSPHTAIHTYEEMSKDLHEFVENFKLDSIKIIGHSMGGKTAMSYTLENGDKVDKLINVDISPYSYHGLSHFTDQYSYHQSIINTFLEAPIKELKSRAEVESFFNKTITNTAVRRFLLKNLKRDKNGSFSWKLNVNTIFKSLSNVIDAAPPIKMGAQSYVDSLFIRGDKSPYISDEDMESILDVFPNASFITYENSGHWLHSEQPERFIKDVREFLL